MGTSTGKKLLLSAGLLAALCSPGTARADDGGRADINLDIKGLVRSYALYSGGDESGAPSLHKFDFRRDTEMWFTGETRFDSGLSAGIMDKLKMGSEANNGGSNAIGALGKDPSQTHESYVYFKDSWGRVNLGSTEGAAFTLQVWAPAADSNIDGGRTQVQSFDSDAWDDGIANHSFVPAGASIKLGYENTDFRNTDRISYFTPKWKGFEAGVSYAPEAGQQNIYSSTGAAVPDNRAGKFENLFEAAARWKGDTGPFITQAGAGYATAATEADKAPGLFGSDNLTSWDADANVAYREFSFGGGYKHTTTGTAGPHSSQFCWILGAAWDEDPWHLGATYYRTGIGANAFGYGLADDLDLTRYTVGGGYQVAPGISFRGSIAILDADNGSNSTNDPTQAQVALGSMLNF